jgi:hypothetical protein
LLEPFSIDLQRIGCVARAGIGGLPVEIFHAGSL